MNKVFMDTVKAAAFMGLSRYHFERTFVDTKRIEVLRFNPSGGNIPKGDGKHLFRVADLEKLRDANGKR